MMQSSCLPTINRLRSQALICWAGRQALIDANLRLGPLWRKMKLTICRMLSQSLVVTRTTSSCICSLRRTLSLPPQNFNADWIIDGEQQPKSLFKMIKNTFETTPDHVLSAYKDNAAVMEGSEVGRYFADHETGRYDFHQEPAHILMKVETHNHPTAISPWPGAATGSGGEIRDEGATGRGAKPKAGLVGFSVSNLRILASNSRGKKISVSLSALSPRWTS